MHIIKHSRIVSAGRRRSFALPVAFRHVTRWPQRYCYLLHASSGPLVQVHCLPGGLYLHAMRSGIRFISQLPF